LPSSAASANRQEDVARGRWEAKRRHTFVRSGGARKTRKAVKAKGGVQRSAVGPEPTESRIERTVGDRRGI